MVCSREKYFIKYLIKSLKDYSLLLTSILRKNYLCFDRDIELMQNETEDALDCIYNGAFMPVYRGDHLSIILSISKSISEIRFLCYQLNNNKHNFDFYKNNGIDFAECANLFNDIIESFNNDNWSIKLLYKNFKNEIQNIETQFYKKILLDKSRSNNDMINDLALKNVIQSIKDLFDSILKTAVKLQF